jgi:hypothetical protein
MSMPNISYTVTGVGTSPIYAADNFQAPFNVGVGVSFSASASYTVEFTFDDIMAEGYVASSGTWFSDGTFGSATTKKAASLTIPCRGIRLNVSASTGTATIQIQQSGER